MGDDWSRCNSRWSDEDHRQFSGYRLRIDRDFDLLPPDNVCCSRCENRRGRYRTSFNLYVSLPSLIDLERETNRVA